MTPVEALQWSVGGVLGASAIGKVLDFKTFVWFLQAPFRRLAGPLAALTITTEAWLAVTLATRKFWLVALVVATAFLVCATTFLAYQVVRDRNIDCGCFGRLSGLVPRHDWGALRTAFYGVRNGSLLLAAAYATTLPDNPIPVWTMGLLGVSCPLIIAAGLMISIWKHWTWLSATEHPVKKILAPNLRQLVVLSWYGGKARYGYSGTVVSRMMRPQ